MAFITIGGARIDFQLIDGGKPGSPTIVMLHEGLGSISLWKDFPAQLARATQSNIVVYSRQGYGRSAPLLAPRTVRYMHDEALVVLPQLLDVLRIENPLLFGHSDGASIALIHAGGSGRPVAGIIAVAPHVLVEELSVTSIATAKSQYESEDLRERLARYHDDVDGAFRGWNDIWLDPAFRAWNIEEFLPRIQCPILAIQGEEDQYGTMDQIERIARAAADVELLKLTQCRHSPQRDRPDAVLDAAARFTARIRASVLGSRAVGSGRA